MVVRNGFGMDFVHPSRCLLDGPLEAKQLAKFMSGQPPSNMKFSQFLLNDRPLGVSSL